MKPKEFQKFLDRDGHCYHCGTTDGTLVPQHRAGRGMGGSKYPDAPANVIVLCSYANGQLESDPVFAALGRKYGWKITRNQDPRDVPVFDLSTGRLWYLDSFGGRQESSHIL